MEKDTLTENLQVSRMASNLIGSEIIKLATEVKSRMAAGEKILNLTIGDFDPDVFPIPQELCDYITEAYRRGETNYPAANGQLELRRTIKSFIGKRLGLHYGENEFLVSAGARPLIFATYMTVIDPGDKVVYPVPSWNNNHYTHISGANSVFVETSEANMFMPTAADLEPHIKDATLLALCSPLNPTGTTFRKEDLLAICEMVLAENKQRGPGRKPLYLLYDQIYWNLTFRDTVHHDPVSLIPAMRDFTIYIDGISKAFAATGVRVGWAYGPEKIIVKMKSILSHVGAWSPKAEQMATASYLSDLENVDSFIQHMRSEILFRLEGFYKGFNTLRDMGYNIEAISPEAAMYLTVKIDLRGMTTLDGKTLETVKDVTAFLLSEAKIALVPFYAFGSSHDSPWYRLSVGTCKKEQVKEAIDNITRAVKSLH